MENISALAGYVAKQMLAIAKYADFMCPFPKRIAINPSQIRIELPLKS